MSVFLRVLQKDCLLHYRDFFGFLAIFLFCVSLLLILHFSFSFEKKKDFFVGSYWVCVFFSHTIFFQRSVALEKNQGGLERLLLVPVTRIVLMFSKISIYLFSSLLLQFLLFPIFTIFFDKNFFIHFFDLLPLLFLSSLGFCVLGSFITSLTVELKFQEIMTPLLLFPMSIPLLLSSMRIMQEVIFESSLQGTLIAFKFLVSFNVIYLFLCWVCYEFVLE